MSATYEPGTFVRVRYGDVDQVGIVRPRKSAAGNLEVAYASGGYDMLGSLRPTRRADVRPLVVIDREDREQVERLAINYAAVASDRLGDEYLAWENRSAEARDRIAADLTAALREFANPTPPKPTPPKPAEPLGLGAVVEDADGRLWFRMTLENQTHPGEVWQERYGEADRWSKWESVAAVRILSKGVTPC